VRTEVLRADNAGIARAAEVIRSGGLVAFPTETVYGLGADALNENAVRKIFLAKERPPDDPLIVHIASVQQITLLARHIPQRVWDVTERFWPGPLTLVLPKTEKVPAVTTGGLDTVAVRAPAHPVAKKLIELSGCPIAAPSANLFGRPSPTTAQHVLEDLDGRIELVVDGGPTPIGVESTVLDMTQDPPMILRPGGVTLEALQEILGEVRLLRTSDREAARRSPGTRYRHYAPRATLILAAPDELEEIMTRLRGRKVGLIAVGHYGRGVGGEGQIVLMPSDLSEYARRLFAVLRELDERGVEVIVVEKVEERGLGRAIMDRLRRASSGDELDSSPSLQ
jgi:L-threonylcarbamoyladenylate synthase